MKDGTTAVAVSQVFIKQRFLAEATLLQAKRAFI